MTSQHTTDVDDLKRLGYAQELLRDMGGFSNFAISFSVVSILTGLSQLYGYGLSHGGPLQMSLGWFTVSFFTMTVAMAMAELASRYPTAGALYHWSSFLGGRAVGWFTACFNTIGQFAILAGIDYGLAQFLVGLVEIERSPATINTVYVVLLFSHALINHFGIHLVAKLNDFSAWYHIAVVMFLVGALAMVGFSQPIHFLVTTAKTDSYPLVYSFLIGLLLSQWTLTGYDASAHVTEETVNPRKRAPWGIVLAVGVSVIAGFCMLAAVTLSIPDLSQAMGFGDGAFIEILKLRLGPGLGRVLVTLIAGAMWLCGLSGMTSASRMVYAFARDGGLPFSKFWAKVSTTYKTPANAIWGLAVVATLLALSVKLYSAVVSIATIALYISYGLPIACSLYADHFQKKKKHAEPGPWNLGKFSVLNSLIAVAWVCFICVLFVLPPNEQAGIVVGVCFIALLLLWIIYVRRNFSGPKKSL